ARQTPSVQSTSSACTAAFCEPGAWLLAPDSPSPRQKPGGFCGARIMAARILCTLEDKEGQLYTLSVKNTSLDVEPWLAMEAQQVLPQLSGSKSAPALSSRAPDAAVSFTHEMGTCRPCFFFRGKADGCWKGAQCERCHICTLPEMHQRRNRLQREMRRAKAAQAAAVQAESHGPNRSTSSGS
ncbi:unnamed protein product, partial [Effrenium voratum]